MVLETFVFKDDEFEFKISCFGRLEGLEYMLKFINYAIKDRKIMYDVRVSGKVSIKEVSVVRDKVTVVLE